MLSQKHLDQYLIKLLVGHPNLTPATYQVNDHAVERGHHPQFTSSPVRVGSSVTRCCSQILLVALCYGKTVTSSFSSCLFVCCLCVFMWVSADVHACSVCTCVNAKSEHCIFLNCFPPNLLRQDSSLTLGPNSSIQASFTPYLSTHRPLHAGVNNTRQTSRHFAGVLGSELGSSSVCHRHLADLAVTPSLPSYLVSFSYTLHLHSLLKSPIFWTNLF